MLKKTLIATVLASATALAVAAPAQADGVSWHWNENGLRVTTWDNDRDRHDDRRVVHRAPRQQVLSARVDRRVVNGTLPLRQILGIGANYRGYRVEAVTVTLNPRNSHGTLRLMVDGRVADRHVGLNQRVITLYPRRDDVIGREVGSLALDVNGKAYVHSVNVRLSPTGHSAGRPVGRPDYSYGNYSGPIPGGYHPDGFWNKNYHRADQTP
ncbi:MAG: hypothetical protein H6907_03300 [Hyphomicrobiales bacterium]|nr:hypothetical protein [Hyphomicrobiales bacterium]MCP5370734.1 hypothetical protein [Hyphomicrobiales bacterium]